MLWFGCGNGPHRKPTSITPSSTQTRAAAAKPLAAPIYARCGTETFARPKAVAASRKRPPVGWQVVYQYPPNAPRRPRSGQTTTITLFEREPAGPAPKLGDAKEVTVAGRRVLLHDRTKKTLYVAVWQTGKARYTALADGATPAALKRIIGCLP
jgi:hypothetical protein